MWKFTGIDVRVQAGRGSTAAHPVLHLLRQQTGTVRQQDQLRPRVGLEELVESYAWVGLEEAGESSVLREPSFVISP